MIDSEVCPQIAHFSLEHTHSLSYVVPFEEHTGSSNEGQLSTQMQRASLGPNALQGSRSVKHNKQKSLYDLFVLQNLTISTTVN